jgi:hypothetical protein
MFQVYHTQQCNPLPHLHITHWQTIMCCVRVYVAFPRSEYYGVVRLPLYLRHCLAFSACSCLPTWMSLVLVTASARASNHHGSDSLSAHSRHVPSKQGAQKFSQVPTRSFRHTVMCRCLRPPLWEERNRPRYYGLLHAAFQLN